MVDLVRELRPLRQQVLEAVAAVVDSGRFVLGPNVEAFEREVADHLGARHAVGVNSGTDALVIALRALGVGDGDEVVTTAFTFFATAESVSAVGATPVFVDIDTDTFCLDVAQVEAALTPRTRAVLPVHLFGRAADMDPLLALARAHGLAVVEDVAQAFGARHRGRRLGTLGHLGAFSFFPSKNLGALGDGGLVVTDDDALAESCRMLRAHGGRGKYQNEMVGYNSRLDEIQAAVLRVKLPHVDEWNRGRRRVAQRYSGLIGGLGGVATPDAGAEHVFHQYTVRVGGSRRDEVRGHLGQAGIDTMVYYPTPLHRLPVYADAHARRRLPEAERASREVLSLPMSALPFDETQEEVVDRLREALDRPPGPVS